jgi:hypothetical protein
VDHDEESIINLINIFVESRSVKTIDDLINKKDDFAEAIINHLYVSNFFGTGDKK